MSDQRKQPRAPGACPCTECPNNKLISFGQLAVDDAHGKVITDQQFELSVRSLPGLGPRIHVPLITNPPDSPISLTKSPPDMLEQQNTGFVGGTATSCKILGWRMPKAGCIGLGQ